MNIQTIGRRALAVKNKIANCTTEEKNTLLQTLADVLCQNAEAIFAANAQDLKNGKENGLSTALLDRLRLTEERLAGMVEGIQQIIALPDPCAGGLRPEKLACGLLCRKKIVPFGVIAMIYEARPNVTVDAAALGLKSGNAMILRGGKEAMESNKALAACIHQALAANALPTDTVQLIESVDRQLVLELIKMRDCIDLVIPRGGEGLIRQIVENSTVPVIETGSGICHTYVDEAADLEMAKAIIYNAKVQRPSVCNAMETLLVHEKMATTLLPAVATELFAAGVEIRGDETTCRLLPTAVPAMEKDWATEYNDLILAVKVVAGLDEALQHIQQYGTRHSECIISADQKNAVKFMQDVDAAAVYVNASTRFTDGFEFGLGAEIGISTQKMHVRGPMGLEALVTYKYQLYGQGEIRQ